MAPGSTARLEAQSTGAEQRYLGSRNGELFQELGHIPGQKVESPPPFPSSFESLVHFPGAPSVPSATGT